MARKVSILGCGPGSPDFVTPAVRLAALEASVLVGAQRLLDLFPESDARRVALGSNIGQTLDEIERIPDTEAVAVLVSGDPGAFSLAKPVIERFGRDACHVIPGISSLQAAFAAVRLDWSDAVFISAHKDDPDEHTVRRAEAAGKIAILAGRKASPTWIARFAAGLPWECRLFLCEDLTLESERIREVAVERLRKIDVSSRAIALVIRKDHLE